MKNLFFGESRFVMKGKPLETPRIDGSVDVENIAGAAGEKRGREAAYIAQALTSSPILSEKMKKIVVSVEWDGIIPSGGRFVSKEQVGSLYELVYPQINGIVGGWNANEIGELLRQSISVEAEDVASVVACVYAYYLLKMAQDEYDKLSPDKKSKITSYSLKTDTTGNVSVGFVESESTPATPAEVAGIQLKAGKTFDDMKTYVEAIPGLNLASFAGEVPKDFDFVKDWNKLEPKIRAVLQSPDNRGAVEGFKVDLGNIFENVDDANFVSFFSKATAVYYMQAIKSKFDATYDPAKMASIADWANAEYSVNYELKIAAGAPEISFNASEKFTAAYDRATEVAQESAQTPEQQTALDALKQDPLISALASMSGEGEALLGKVARKEPAGFFGFLIAIIAGIKGITGFEGTWITIKSYTPDSLKPVVASVEEKVLQGTEEVKQRLGRENDAILQLLANEKKYTVPDGLLALGGGLRFAEDFDSKQGGQFVCMEVTIDEDGETVNFGENITGGIIKDGQSADYQVVDKMLKEKGVYRITCSIPKGTVFSKGVDLRLLKANAEASPSVAQPATDVAAAPAGDTSAVGAGAQADSTGVEQS